jgi:hypothetical protein
MYKIINKKNNFIILLIFLIVIILIELSLIFNNNFSNTLTSGIKNQNNLNDNSLSSKVEEPKTGNIESVSKKIILPAGAQTYEVIQNKSVWPKILEAKIDPVDVHVGDKQTLSIIVSSKEKIKEVVAYIETDNGTTTLPLNFREEVSDNDLLPKKYDLDDDNKLVILEDKDRYNFLKSIGFIFDKIKPFFGANAGASNGNLSDLNLNAQNENNLNYPKLKYENSWIVRDTHDKYYHTVFVVEDVLGNKNSITLAWSDACGIPNSGIWAIQANCTISSTDGVENGNATINTYTLTLNAPFVWNPGYSINIGSGSIAIGSGGSLQKAYLFYTDSDGDGYYPNTTLNISLSSSASGMVRRSSALGTDCNDSNASLNTLKTGYVDNDGDGRAGTYVSNACVVSVAGSSSDCNDSNANVWNNGYGYDGDRDGYGTSVYGCYNGNYPYDATLGTDCNDSNANLYRYLTGYQDNDGDGYTIGSAQQVCSGASLPSGWRSFANGSDCNDNNNTVWQYLNGYIDNDGDGYGAGTLYSVCSGSSLPSGYVSNNTDCYDSNANAHPGQTSFFLVNRGDGSFDYNCNGGIEQYRDSTLRNCFNVADSICTSRGLSGTSGACQQGTSYWRYYESLGRYDWHDGWVSPAPSCGNSQYLQIYSGSGVVCERTAGSDGTCYGFYLCNLNANVALYCR